MAELTTLARPYAKAAFATARGQDALAQWSHDLQLAALVVANPDMRRILGLPGISESEKAELLCDCFETSPSESVKNFFSLLSENRRLALLPEINTLFQGYRAEFDRTLDVNLSTPYELTDEQQHKLAEALSQKLERKVTIETSLDKTLIGGVVIRTGDMVIDASVRGRLNKLADSLGS